VAKVSNKTILLFLSRVPSSYPFSQEKACADGVVPDVRVPWAAVGVRVLAHLHARPCVHEREDRISRVTPLDSYYHYSNYHPSPADSTCSTYNKGHQNEHKSEDAEANEPSSWGGINFQDLVAHCAGWGNYSVTSFLLPDTNFRLPPGNPLKFLNIHQKTGNWLCSFQFFCRSSQQSAFPQLCSSNKKLLS